MDNLSMTMSKYGYAENPILVNTYTSTFTNNVNSLVKIYKENSKYRIEVKIIIGNEVIKSLVLKNVSNIEYPIRNIHDAIVNFDYKFDSLLNKISFDK